MADPRPMSHETYIRRISGVSLAIALAAIIGLSVYLSTQSPSSNRAGQQTAHLPVILTPQSFQDFIGTVAGTDGNIFVVTMGVASTTTTRTQTYQVTIDSKTSLFLFKDRATGPEMSPATLADFKVGDTVHVFGAENLFSVKTFTATKIYKVIST